jgi:hypothetical protein
MGKKLSLQELAASSSNSTNSNSTKPQESTLSKGKEVSVSDIRQTIPKPEIDESEINKPPEVLTNAIQDMVTTMEGKKKKFDEEIRPQVEAAREEAEIEAALAEAEAGDTDDITDSSEEDDIDEIDAMINAEPDRDELSVESDAEPEIEYDIKVGDSDSVVVSTDGADLTTEHITTDDRVQTKEAVEVTPVSRKIEIKDSKSSSFNNLEDEIENIDSLLGDLEADMSDSYEDVEVDGDDTEVESADETIERMKKQGSKLMATKTADRSGFKVRKKGVSSSSLLSRMTKAADKKTSDWVLLSTGKTYTFSEVSGPELDALQKTISNSNNLNGVIASLRLVYNHIVDANKPGFETWCKLTKYEDLESLYFGIYKACYGDVNLIGRSCDKDTDAAKEKLNPHCEKTSIIDTPIDTMYKFADDESKEKFNKLMNTDTTTSTSTIESRIIDISDQFAIGYSDPTLFTTLLQFSSLNQNLVQKHEEMLNTLAYIDDFYYIDNETKEYVRMEYKMYPDNFNKTIMSKLKVYIEICKLITSDQYDTMVTKIASEVDKESKITYILPKTVCPECGATIPEQDAGSMLGLLFTHRQLTAIVNS